ncbi:MAG: hypothetical protein WD967_02150 [Candidatus Levyibacteriota bacterium]
MPTLAEIKQITIASEAIDGRSTQAASRDIMARFRREHSLINLPEGISQGLRIDVGRDYAIWTRDSEGQEALSMKIGVKYSTTQSNNNVLVGVFGVEYADHNSKTKILVQDIDEDKKLKTDNDGNPIMVMRDSTKIIEPESVEESGRYVHEMISFFTPNKPSA